MSLKSNNPYLGLRQIISGYYFVPRIKIVNLARKYKLKPLEIGYYVMFLTSTDWDSNSYRKGYIRLDLTSLAKVWNVPKTTLTGNLKKLIDKGLIKIIGEGRIPMLVDFESHTFSGHSQISKAKYSNEFLNKYFKNLDIKNEVPSTSKLNISQPFKSSFKKEFKDDLNTSDIPINKGGSFFRTNDEYQKIYDKDPDSLSVEEMKDIDISLDDTF